MSHSTVLIDRAQLQPATVTIQNYVIGGEAVTAAEFNGLGVNGVTMGQIPASQNSLAVPLFPILNNGKIMLFRFNAGTFVEIPATVGLNAVIFGIVHVTAWT